jgi:hypothetical protein
MHLVQIKRMVTIIIVFLVCADALSTIPKRPQQPPGTRKLPVQVTDYTQHSHQENEIVLHSPQRHTQRDAMINVVAGILGSAIGEAVAYPVDVMKTRIQSSSGSSSPVKALAGLLQERGLFGMYAGLSAPLLGSVIIKTCVFGGYEVAKRLVRMVSSRKGSGYHSKTRHLTFLEGVIASTGAGIFAAFAYAPIDRVKITMQLANNGELVKMSTLVTFLKLAKEGTLFRGIICCLAREAPYNACYFTLYERTRDWVVVRNRKKNNARVGMAWWVAPVVGGFAGAMSWLIVLPADIAKTLVQAGLAPNFGAALCELLRDRGLGGMYTGASTVVIRAVLKHSVTFTMFEALRPMLRSLFQAPEAKLHVS